MIRLEDIKAAIVYRDKPIAALSKSHDRFNGTCVILCSKDPASIDRLAGCISFMNINQSLRIVYSADPQMKAEVSRRAKSAFSTISKSVTSAERTGTDNFLFFIGSDIGGLSKSTLEFSKKLRKSINDAIDSIDREAYPNLFLLIDADDTDGKTILKTILEYPTVVSDECHAIAFTQPGSAFCALNGPPGFLITDEKKLSHAITEMYGYSVEGSSHTKEITANLREKVLAKLAIMVDSVPGTADFGKRIIVAVDNVIHAAEKDANEDAILSKLAEDKDFQRELDHIKSMGKESFSQIKKAQVLAAKQQDIDVIAGKEKIKLSQLIKKDDADMALGFFEIPDQSISDPQMRTSRVKQINRMYAKHYLFSDAVLILTSLNNDPDYPTFLTALSILDTSDEFNKKWTITAALQTTDGKRQTINVDIPKVTDDGIMYLNGTKKFISKQMVALPVVKRKEDQVQITTQYNKTFIERHGTKLSAPIEKLRKFLLNKSTGKIKVKLGDASKLVPRSRNALVFEELSKSFMSIAVDTFIYDFDTHKLEVDLRSKYPERLKKLLAAKPDCTIIGNSPTEIMYIDGEEVYSIDIKSGTITNMGTDSLVHVIASQIHAVSPELFSELVKTQTGKVFSYSIIRLLQRAVPVVVLLSFKEGLEQLMSKYGIRYEFKTKRAVTADTEKMKLGTIQFKDGYLYYDASKLSYEILMNGLLAVPTRNYTFEDMNRQMPYLDFFDENYNTRNISKGFRNFWQRLIDPITEGILKQQGIPSDFTGLILHSNSLLTDNKRKSVTDMSNYRIRSLEIIVQALYQELSTAFLQYKTNVAAGSNRKTIQIRKDGVIRRIIDSQNVEELSLLSPVIELESQDKITFKGIGGINKEESFTDDFRTFDPSMIGTFGYFTPTSSQAGISRTLSHNPAIETVRGFVTPDPRSEDKSASELLSTTELLNSFMATRADPSRIGMTVTQNKHVTPTTKQSKPLINSGAHKAIAYLIGDDFVFKAKDAGVVEAIDVKNQVVIVKYNNGEKGLIDTKPKLNKNSKAGFYLESQLKHTLKVGQKFKYGEILAYDPTFFKEGAAFSGGSKSIELATGLLRKVALCTDAGTFEDSLIESHSLAEDLGFPVVTDKFVALGKNSHIAKIVKIGDVIKASDSLMVFENSFDEAEVNDVLRRLGSQFGQEIIELGRNTVSSKSSGRVVDIRVFFNVPLEELSISLRKVVNDYITLNKKRSDIVMKHESNDIVQISQMTQIQYNKLFGQEFDGVLLQFFVSHVDECTVGDKISAQVALKGVISQVLGDDQRPYTEGDKEDPIDLIVSPMSVVSRMTVDLFFNLYANKVLVELKKKCKKIWNN